MNTSLRISRTLRELLFDSSRSRSRRLAGRRFLEQVALCGSKLDAKTEPSTEVPVFLLGVGWKTGSTLLQRIMMTDARLCMWGEPFGRLAILQQIRQALAAIDGQWPPQRFFIENQPGIDLTRAYVANLYPSIADLLAGIRSLFDAWLAAPARKRGFERWGVKEVRWDYADACLLRSLYPRARIVVLIRHPFECYRSAKVVQRFWSRWPDSPIDNPLAFARNWDRLATGWNSAPQLGHKLVRYEDLVSADFDFAPLAEFVELKLNPGQALSTRVGGTSPEIKLGFLERILIRAAASRSMRAFGYM